MKKAVSGFTLIELIVVITVIAILTGISIISYNGAQQRARTSQTLSSANQWVKALMIYKARNGGLPTANSCLGTGYRYNSNAQGTSGVAQCYQNAGVNVVINSTFTTAMSPYISGAPSPAMVSAVNSTSSWYRGIAYTVSGNAASLTFALDAGQACPLKITDYNRIYSGAAGNGNMVCMYNLGSTVSYGFS